MQHYKYSLSEEMCFDTLKAWSFRVDDGIDDGVVWGQVGLVVWLVKLVVDQLVAWTSVDVYDQSILSFSVKVGRVVQLDSRLQNIIIGEYTLDWKMQSCK